jgi:hypothetical protein
MGCLVPGPHGVLHCVSFDGILEGGNANFAGPGWGQFQRLKLMVCATQNASQWIHLLSTALACSDLTTDLMRLSTTLRSRWSAFDCGVEISARVDSVETNNRNEREIASQIYPIFGCSHRIWCWLVLVCNQTRVCLGIGVGGVLAGK